MLKSPLKSFAGVWRQKREFADRIAKYKNGSYAPNVPDEIQSDGDIYENKVSAIKYRVRRTTSIVERERNGAGPLRRSGNRGGALLTRKKWKEYGSKKSVAGSDVDRAGGI